MQKFFCDNCGTQVKKNETRCPKCGRYFRSVKCPSCGLSGSPELFNDGCPSCGYAKENFDSVPENYDAADFEPGKPAKKSGFFSERFYRRAIPVLVLIIIALIILLVRTGG